MSARESAKTWQLKSVVGASMASRVISVAGALIQIRLVAGYLGAEQYGLFLTIATTLVLLAFLDLGVGEQLINSVSAERATGTSDAINRWLASSISALTCVSLLLAVLITPVLLHIDFSQLVSGATDAYSNDLRNSVLVVWAGLLFGLPVATSPRLLLAFGKPVSFSIVAGGTTLLQLAAQGLVVYFGGGLVQLIAALVFVPPIINLAVFVALCRTQLDGGRLKLKGASLQAARHLLQNGLLFAGLQLLSGMSIGADNWILASAVGPTAVATYGPTLRLYAVCAIMAYIWPSIRPKSAQLFAAGDYSGIRRLIVRFSALSGLFSVVVALASLLLGGIILSFLTQGIAEFSTTLWISFSIWLIVYNLVTLAYNVNCGLSKVHLHLLVFGLATVCATGLKYIAATNGAWEWMPLAYAIAFGIIYLPWAMLRAGRPDDDSKSRSDSAPSEAALLAEESANGEVKGK